MIPADLEERILPPHFVEKWTMSTIAKQYGIHHSTVQRVLHTRGVTVQRSPRTSTVDLFLPFLQQPPEPYPTLPSSRLHRMVAERGQPGGPDQVRPLVSRRSAPVKASRLEQQVV